MFCKPYKIKSHNSLKNTDKKALSTRLKSEFPGLTDDDLRCLLPARATATWLRVVLASGATVSVLAVDGPPLLLEVDGRLVPTVVALWRLPALLPSIAVHEHLLPKLQSGVPLYLPGVLIPAQGVGFPLFARGSLLALRTGDNDAAAAVGRALLSSADMLLKVGGTCFEAFNVAGDLLCKEAKFGRIERPRLTPQQPAPAAPAAPVAPVASPALTPAGRTSAPVMMQYSKSLSRQTLGSEEWPALGSAKQAPPTPVHHSPAAPTAPTAPTAPSVDALGVHLQALDVQESKEVEEDGKAQLDCDHESERDSERDRECECEQNTPADMDALLRHCLLGFMKHGARSVELPLKTNLLYKNHMIPLCPPDRMVDVRKSSYKKMGKFLNEMQKEGLLEVRSIDRGVDAVVSLNTSHPAVRGHAAPAPAPAPAPSPAPAPLDYRAPAVRELLALTAPVVPLFDTLKKGATVTPGEVRAAVTQYVQRRQLATAERPGYVTLDDTLAAVLHRATAEQFRWEELVSGVQARMTACTELRFPDGATRLVRTRLQPVTMATVTRAGNKKVTLVSNLEPYGFNLQELARACQAGAAASCGVTRTPGAKADQLALQGDQTYFMAKLLIETFGLPKKFVEGADKALKKKNK